MLRILLTKTSLSDFRISFYSTQLFVCILKEKIYISQFSGDWDSQYECYDIDEDKLIDDLEDTMAEGNILIEHHVTDIFPERWFDAVFVLRTDNTQIFDRLRTRNYNQKKLDDNVQCEIFQTILDEARESYKPEIVHEIRSDVLEDIETNANNISLWIDHWIKNNES